MVNKPSKNQHERFVQGASEARLLDLRTLQNRIPDVGIFDNPKRCYEINNEWAKLLLGFMDWLTEEYVWDETTGDVQGAIEQIRDMLVGTGCGMDCNEIDDCLDTIPDWIALTNLTYQNAVNAPETTPQELEDLYDGTPQSIAPTMPDDLPNTIEVNRLCYVAYRFVSYYAATKVSEISLTNALQTSMNSILEAAKRIVGANNLGLLGAILGDLTYGCAATVDEALAALQDDSAATDVACVIYNHLRCVTFTQAEFDNALTIAAGTGFANPNAEIIACMLLADNSDDLYRIFLFGYKVASDYEDNGVVLDCPCTGAYWSYDWNFADGLGEWEIADGFLGAGYVEGEDVGTHKSLIILLTFPEDIQINAVRIVYERSGFAAFGFFDGHAVLLRPTAGSSTGQTTFYSGTDNGNQVYNKCGQDITPPLPPTNTSQLRVDIGCDDAPAPAFARLYRVMASGTLSIPPYANAIDNMLLCDEC